MLQKNIKLFFIAILAFIVFTNSYASVNLVNGYWMDGKVTGRNYVMTQNGIKLFCKNLELTAQSSYNLSWLQGHISFDSILGHDSFDAEQVFSPYTTSINQFNSGNCWNDKSIKKITLYFKSNLRDGEPAIDIRLDDCIIYFHNGICEFKCIEGVGKFKDKIILDFDGDDFSRKTNTGAGFNISTSH